MGESRKKANLNDHLPRGARTKLATKHGISKTLVGAIVRGQRIDYTDVYDDALFIIAEHRKQQRENETKAIEQMEKAKELEIAS